MDEFDPSRLRTRIIRPDEQDDDDGRTWHRNPRNDEIRRLAAETGQSIVELGYDVPMFRPGQEHLPELPDPRVKDVLPHDPLGFLRAAGENAENLPAPKPITLEDAQRERDQKIANIFKHHSLLKGILERHEATMQKRWLKKTKDQKKRILLAAWPSMPVLHRPDIDSFRDWEGGLDGIGARQRSACMWPSINQEDLSKPKSLLLFLNARGRNPPCDFAASDFDAMHIGLTCGAIVPRFLDSHLMLLLGRSTHEKYAELVARTEYKPPMKHIPRYMNPGEALLILECQERITSFLVSCAKEIMHDLGDETSLLSATGQPEPPSVSEIENGIPSLATMTAERPYRPATHFSFLRIESILAAKADACEDHLWQSREDPSYFEKLALEAYEHREERLLGMQDEPHALFQQRPPRLDIIWSKIIGNQASHAYMDLEFWSELAAQARSLREAGERNGHLDADSPLPDDMLNALLRFRYYLDKAFEGMGQLEQDWVSSPAWRKFFRSSRLPLNDPTAHMFKVAINTRSPMSKVQQQLMWLGKCLWDQKKTLRLAKPINVIDELNRIIESDSKAKEMFSPRLLDAIAGLSIVAECARQLDLFQPWASILPELLKDNATTLQKQWEAKERVWAPMMRGLVDGGKTLLVYGLPTDDRFQYPVAQRRTRKSTEQMRKAEASLDKFWEVADRMLKTKAGKLEGTHLRQLLSQEKPIRRTPEWVEPEPTSSGKLVSQTEEVAIEKPLSEIYFDLEQRTERTLLQDDTSQHAKAKLKTRGVASSDAALSTPEETLPEAVSQPSFAVDTRASKVFKTLFYTPSPGATPGEVAWTDFVYALDKIGFRAEKLYGSVWQFSPTVGERRSIQFHEPHPEKKISFYTARRYGRRLHRAYGWTGDMFAVSLDMPKL